ncbi:MAG: hypothetical protein DRJ03_04535 [Chloroflexi bacterium]|nr:MAG: hypothetical protein B6I35_02570 [Anaerolineaceae bacterium 4572_32.2]RLC82242.1 MAG: hypothetical protein DRI81_00320 [Chloroflexota bacterium]RLC87883.1 MAG: hypothetical protein DRJ03_04535 [Chloroflexota bacterium]HEY73152.1 hypothetical protein [Thermoflexia bacterium]
MRLKKILIWLALFALLCVPTASYAQDYGFSLDQEVVDVWINPDGSVTLEYRFTFTCDTGAHPIDVVDVGLPTGDYTISGVSGDLDGAPIARVDGDYQGGGDHGVAVWLDDVIFPEQTGTVHVFVDRVGGMVYEDSDDAEYASTEFSPTWFGSQFSHGDTDLTVYFHLPEGVQPEEPRWHRSPSGWPQDQPETALDDDGRVVYIWHNPSAAPDRQYTFGASFPRRYVAEDAVQEGPSALELIFGAIFGAISSAASCCCNPVPIFFVVIAGFIGLSVYGQRKRKLKYLPPSMKVEGVGIKRGLTAVEAAILLETPLNKVMTMILFGLLKKGAVTVLDDNPLKIEVNEPLPEKLRSYETAFLKTAKKDGALSEKRLRAMMVALIKEVNNKMKGFSRKESVAYYEGIVKRAWQQVEGADTPEMRGQQFDEQLGWTMLDDDFEERTNRTFRTGPVFMPMWWGYYRPWGRAHSVPRPSSSRPSTPTPSVGRVQLPTLPGAAFAASIVNGVQTTSSRIIKNVTGFTGGVTQVTNPPPKPSSSGRSYSGGSSSCACACACAGCACACAGGGR